MKLSKVINSKEFMSGIILEDVYLSCATLVNDN